MGLFVRLRIVPVAVRPINHLKEVSILAKLSGPNGLL